MNHKLVFFNFSWDGLDSLFGSVTLILQVMQVNHLASKALLVFQPVVIPVLEPSLDHALVQDRFLCPVRALRGYLDKKKISRKARNSFCSH